jgi:DNA repair photolyase
MPFCPARAFSATDGRRPHVVFETIQIIVDTPSNICSHRLMRWQGQELGVADAAALPGMEQLNGLVRSVTTPEFAGVTFHEVLCRSALNHVPSASAMPFDWTVNPYRGCSHACVYCFARGTHEYLELDPGRDFDTQVVVKINVAEVLEKELRRGSWQRDPVMLGTNTDPYQRAEGRYKLMPGIVSALTESGTPFSILTKGTLLRRDLPMLKDAAADVHVTLAMSIAVFDDELQHLIEPGTPTANARLETVRAATEAGFRVTVFLMPIIPHLTDSVAAIDHALTRIKEAGAVRVVYGALHLRPGAKQWFFEWLEHRHPELVSSYRGLYPGMSANAPKAYKAWLAKRVRPLLRVHRLDGRAEEDQPRGAPVSGLAARADTRAASVVVTSRGRSAAPSRGAARGAPTPTPLF